MVVRCEHLLVDLLARYSNRHDLCDDLEHHAEELRTELGREPRDPSVRVSVRSVQPEAKVRRVADRLGSAKVQAILERFEKGTSKHILAEEFGISLSSVKNLLRTNKAYRPWQVSDRLSPEDIEALLEAYRAGAPHRKLAEQYGIGLSSVASLVRSHGVARRCSQPSG
jgi:uncharacterized protein (DUF433 family)